MKFAVLGPGGVGGLLAGALWRAGSDVTVIARPHTAAADQRAGPEPEQRPAGRVRGAPHGPRQRRGDPRRADRGDQGGGARGGARAGAGDGRTGARAAPAERARPPRRAAPAVRAAQRAGGRHQGGIRPLRARRDRALEPLPADRHGGPAIPPAAPPCRRSGTSSSESGSPCAWATRSPTAPRRR